MNVTLARMVRALRVHELSTMNADSLARWIERADEALLWYATIEYNSRDLSDVQLQSKANEALGGIK